MLGAGARGLRSKAPSQNAETAKAGQFDAYPDLLTVKNMQELTGLSAQTIRAECQKGGIPAVKIGRRWYVPKMRLIECLAGDRGSHA